MRSVPDAPIDLKLDEINVPTQEISFNWKSGFSDGGVPILDYLVLMAENSESFKKVAENLTTLEFKATEVTIGSTYHFQVTARNSVGESSTSVTL